MRTRGPHAPGRNRAALLTRALATLLLILSCTAMPAPSAAQPAAIDGVVADIYIVYPSLGQPQPVVASSVYLISDEQWENQTDGNDGIAVSKPPSLADSGEYLDTFLVRGGRVIIPGQTLRDYKPDDEDDSCFRLLLRTVIAGQAINAWWTVSYAEWRRGWDSPLVQKVYVFPGLDHWTERDAKFNVGDGVDKQVFVLEPDVDIYGDLIVHKDRDPLILVHGHDGEDGTWRNMPQQLRAHGQDVWQFYYPGRQNIRFSAGLLARAVQEVLKHYPGRKVSLAGHSMGGLVTRAYLEGLGLLAQDEPDESSSAASEAVPYGGNVRKWISIASPQQGIYAVNEQIHNDFDDPLCHGLAHIKSVFRSDYILEPSLKQLAAGSRFMWDINRTSLPPDLKPERDVLSIAGTQRSPIGQGCLGTDEVNDGGVDLISASMLHLGAPLLTLRKNHASLIGAKMPPIMNVINDANTENISTIIDLFLREKPYHTGDEDARLFTPQGESPYTTLAADHQRAGLSARYISANGKESNPLTLAGPRPSDIKYYLGVNSGRTSAVSVPHDAPAYYGRSETSPIVKTYYAVGIDQGRSVKQPYTLSAQGVAKNIELKAGHYTQVAVCSAQPALETLRLQTSHEGVSEVTLSWETNLPSTSEAAYSRSGGPSLRQVDPRLVKQHSVRLRGLERGKQYAITITSATDCGAMQTAHIAYAPTPKNPDPVTLNTLVFDVSNSMNWTDAGGARKLDSAREAALRLTRMIRWENEQLKATHQVGVVSFNDEARTHQALTAAIPQAEQAIRGLSADQNTNMAAGLQEGLRQLQGTQAKGRKNLIFLSDGVPTVYLGGRVASSPTELAALEQEISASILPQLAKTADCLYVIGFGNPSDTVNGWPSLDEAFLRKVSAVTSCGGYYNAKTAVELTDIFVTLRHESSGELLASQSGSIQQGQTSSPLVVSVPASQTELHVSLNWPGSRLDLLLTDPRGRAVDGAYPGATFYTSSVPAYAVIANPLAGDWQARAYGAQVPQASTYYSLVASSRQAPQSGNAGLLILLITLGGLGGSAAFLLTRQGGASAPATAAGLVVTVPGAARAYFVPFTRSRPLLRIGRGPGNDINLSDPAVSHHHAQVRLGPGGIAIYDDNSVNGVYVNGVRVPAAQLHHGDEVRIGGCRLGVRVPQRRPAARPARRTQSTPPQPGTSSGR